MDDRTLTALNASIAKWERNATSALPHEYTTEMEDCPLCRLFWYGGCQGCPVFEFTQQECCDLTPFIAAYKAKDAWACDRSNEELRDAAHAAARDEVAFLRSLLPEAAQ